jgi:hypothetical protein
MPVGRELSSQGRMHLEKSNLFKTRATIAR